MHQARRILFLIGEKTNSAFLITSLSFAIQPAFGSFSSLPACSLRLFHLTHCLMTWINDDARGIFSAFVKSSQKLLYCTAFNSQLPPHSMGFDGRWLLKYTQSSWVVKSNDGVRFAYWAAPSWKNPCRGVFQRKLEPSSLPSAIDCAMLSRIVEFVVW